VKFENKIELLRYQLEQKSAFRVKEPDGLEVFDAFDEDGGLLIDIFTASVIVQVYDAVNEKNQQKLLSMSWVAMAMVCLSLVNPE